MVAKPHSALALLAAICTLSCEGPKKKEAPAPQAQTKDAQSASVDTSSDEACRPQDFAKSVDLAEASGATFITDTRVLLVGDSGNHGAFAILDATSGALVQKGALELDPGASDDIEGVSLMDGSVYAITSSGWVRKWSYEGGHFTLTTPSYPLAPADSKGLLCYKGTAINCAKNFEGLCLRHKMPPTGECAGFAAAKATGELICLVADEAGKLALDPSRVIPVASAGSLSGCDFDEDEHLWFGNNFFAASAIGYVENWQAPADAKITRVGNFGFGFPEGIAVGSGGQLVRASDTRGTPSLLSKYICR
jgi:hypothetical protein